MANTFIADIEGDTAVVVVGGLLIVGAVLWFASALNKDEGDLAAWWSRFRLFGPNLQPGDVESHTADSVDQQNINAGTQASDGTPDDTEGDEYDDSGED